MGQTLETFGLDFLRLLRDVGIHERRYLRLQALLELILGRLHPGINRIYLLIERIQPFSSGAIFCK